MANSRSEVGDSNPRKESERRRWTRAEVDLPITVSLSEGKTDARVRDISRAGVCFFLDRPIPMMTVLEVALDLRVKNGVRHVRGNGAVVRCEKIARAVEHYEIAVFLHEMAETDRQCIEEFVGAPA
ncbi:MAG: PilZ domain-containing protein [Planctomycetota bacterium]